VPNAAPLKKMIGLWALIACFSVGAFAAEEQTAERDDLATAESLAAWVTGELVKLLDLTDSQAAKVELVFVDEFAGLEEILDKYKGGMDQDTAKLLRDDIRAIHARTRAALEPVLSSEQLAKLDSLQRERRAVADGALVAYRLQKLLKLSAEQFQQMVPLLARDLKQRHELLESAQEQEGEGGSKAMRGLTKELDALQDELVTQLKPILSDDQLQAYLEYQQAMRYAMRERMKAQLEDQ